MAKITLKHFYNDVFYTKVYSVSVDSRPTSITVHKSWCGHEDQLHQWARDLGLVSIVAPGHPAIDYQNTKTLAQAKDSIGQYLASK